MADIRIKDLTTTASSSASDDFIAVDGTTNGTRKLSAFSPTFGGNATVTGTLSSGGNLSVTGTSAQVILGQASGSQLTYLIRPAQAGGAIQMVQDSATANRWLSLGISDNVGVYSELMRVAGATGNILIPGTVASTTTSSGALVVGNGTSGGLGVGGSINTGGTLRFHTNANLPGVGSIGISATYGLNMYASTGSSYDFTVFNAAGSSLILNPTGTQNLTLPGTLTVNGTGASSFGGRLAIGATALSDRMFYVSGSTGTTGASQFSAVVNPTIPNTVTTSAYGLYLGTNIAAGATVTNGYSLFIAAPDYTGSTVTNKYGLYSSDPNPSYFVGNVLVGSTTASTTTSSGALVVSGGVGVAGAIWAGDNVTVPNSKNFVVRNAAASSTAMRMYADSSDFGYIDCTANTELRLQVGSGTKLSITNTGNVTTTGNITTAAPSGGTAAAWKLGTVATVSPTSPNRTIEVDIGGTIYYIHAKTTNN